MCRPLALPLVALMMGCSLSDAPSSTPRSEGHLTFEHAGLQREYLLHLPDDDSDPVPLILSFHGFLSDMERQRDLSGMVEMATERGMAIAFPNGLAQSWDAGECCAPTDPDRDDLAFVQALIADIGSRLPIDPSRIYATGMSNGAAFAHRLACEAPDLVTAIGPVTSRRRVPEEDCDRGSPRSIVHFHGTADTIADYQEARDQLDEWAQRNGCTDAAPSRPLEIEGAHCEAYTSCQEGAEVWFCTVEGMGHCWPGKASCDTGEPSTALSANAVMLDRFAATDP